MRAIYQCNRGEMTMVELCKQNLQKNRCVKNSRQKGKAFYPLVSGEKIVCVQKAVI